MCALPPLASFFLSRGTRGVSLQKIENILQKHGPARGPFVEGDDLTVGDLTLAVTTYHMQAAFAIEKQW